MKFIKLTQGKVAIVDDEDFDRLSQYKWKFNDFKMGFVSRGVYVSKGKTKSIYLSREIMAAKKGEIVDHINGNTLDNRKVNLRICSNAENLRNKKRYINNRSGYKGVYKIRNKWAARIVASGKNFFLGVFDTKEEAALAYNKAASEKFGEFARLNQI